MSSKRLLNWARGAVVGLLLIGSGTSHRAAAQVTPPKAVKDTAKKPVVSDQRVKIIKETSPSVKMQGAAGEVRLAPCPVDQDSVDRAIAGERRAQDDREQSARGDQRRLDSILAAARVRDAIDRERAIAAAERRNHFLDSVAFAKKAADEAALARQLHLARGFYVGLAAGASAPQRETRNGYTRGLDTTIPFGWMQAINRSAFGPIFQSINEPARSGS